MPKRILSAALFLLLVGFCTAAQNPSLLPSRFAGWKQIEHQSGSDAAAADPANASLLKEYGLRDFEDATYRQDERTLKLRAARFADGTGSFGAFSFYAQPQMEKIDIGDRGVALADHVLFLRANIMVDAVFQPATAMSAAELRELAAELPVVSGADAALPEALDYLPQADLVADSVHYVVGPVGLAAIGSPVPANVANFERSAELVSGEYREPGSDALLTVISFPTPQIALQQQQALAALYPAAVRDKTALQGTVAAQAGNGSEIAFRRSGPLLIYVSGAASANDARSLAQRVNYNAVVTWSQPPPTTVNGVIRVVVYSLVFALMLIAGYLLMVIFLGGGYVAIKKFFPGVKLPAHDNELIKLNLKD